MTITIETPKGSRDKFKYDSATKDFYVKKTLPNNMVFPFAFGFVPNTMGEDGDPLDIVILSSSAHKTGEQLNAKIIGCLPAHQTNSEGTVRNDRFLGVPVNDAGFTDVDSVEQLGDGVVQGIKSFFHDYLTAEAKHIEFSPTMNGKSAEQLLQLAKG